MSRWRKRKPSSSGKVDARRADQLLAHERGEVRLDPVAHGSGRQLGDGAAMEDLALDSASLHDHAYVSVERVDARLQKSLDGRRDRDLAVAAVLAHHREHLLDVQRVARRRDRDPLAQRRRRARRSEEAR